MSSPSGARISTTRSAGFPSAPPESTRIEPGEDAQGLPKASYRCVRKGETPTDAEGGEVTATRNGFYDLLAIEPALRSGDARQRPQHLLFSIRTHAGYHGWRCD